MPSRTGEFCDVSQKLSPAATLRSGFLSFLERSPHSTVIALTTTRPQSGLLTRFWVVCHFDSGDLVGRQHLDPLIEDLIRLRWPESALERIEARLEHRLSGQRVAQVGVSRFQ